MDGPHGPSGNEFTPLSFPRSHQFGPRGRQLGLDRGQFLFEPSNPLFEMGDHSLRKSPKLGQQDGDLIGGNRWLRRRHGGDVTHFAACAKPPFLSRLSRTVNGYTGPVSTPTAAAEPRRQSRERQVNTATGLSVRQQGRKGTKASDSMFKKPFNGSGTKALPRPSGEKIGSVIAIAVENT
jgi:hypothetical protein